MAETVVSEARKARTKKTDEEALKNEALNLFYEIQRHGLKPFEGASVDFHQRRELVVFIPGESPVMAVVKHEELLNFLVKNNVRRILIDAPFPSRAETLIEISKAGIEVYFIRRPTIIEKFRRFLRKHKIRVPSKNDYADAVLQAFIKPKYLQQTDWKYIECLLEMHLWRDNAINYQKHRQRLKTYPPEKRDKVAKLIADIEKTAQDFIDTVVMHYPKVKEHFKKQGITDVITQAYYCEVYLEMKTCRKFNGVLKRAGIDVSQKSKDRKKRLKKSEGNQNEEAEEEKAKKFIYDGKFKNALIQLTLKVKRLNPKSKDRKRIIEEAIRLAKEIWLMLEEERKQSEDGRVGEALGWMSRAHSKGRDRDDSSPPSGRGLEQVGALIRPRSEAPDTRPTDN